MNDKIQCQIRAKGELSEYIEGRIIGIIEGVICRSNGKPSVVRCNDDAFFRFECTANQFTKICNLVGSRCHMFGEFEFLEI